MKLSNQHAIISSHIEITLDLFWRTIGINVAYEIRMRPIRYFDNITFVEPESIINENIKKELLCKK
jgi:hypothetical protein